MTPAHTDHADLRALCEAATPGPWEVCRHLEGIAEDAACPCGYRGVVWGPEHDIPMAVCQPGHDAEPVGQEGLGPMRYVRAQEIANGQFIAAANPARVLALLDERDADKATIAGLREENERLKAELAASERGAEFLAELAEILQEVVGFIASFDGMDSRERRVRWPIFFGLAESKAAQGRDLATVMAVLAGSAMKQAKEMAIDAALAAETGSAK